MKNVLITGGNGFIGQEIAKKLLPQYHVISLSRTKASPHGEQLFKDIQDITPEFLNQRGIDVVIHCAWESLNDFRSDIHFEIARIHLKFFEAIANSNVKDVIALGTCLEYGKIEGEMTEEMPCEPMVAYGKAKLQLFKEAQALFIKNKKPLKWARIFYVFGENQKPTSLYPSILRLKKENSTVFPMSSGIQRRDFIPVEDVAEIIERLIGIQYTGVVNCSSGKGTSVYDFVQQTLDRLGIGSCVRMERGSLSIPDYESLNFWGSTSLLKNLVSKE
jgi:nucleoside-diphosphate-sugar epimerase